MPKYYESKAWMQAQRAKGKDVTQIAKECGVSHTTITRWLIKHGLMKNTRSW